MRLLPYFAPLLICSAAASAQAHEAKVGHVAVVHPIARASLGRVPTSVGYMTLTNSGSQPDRLVAASCACAARVEAHDQSTVDGVSRMKAAGPVAIPARGSTRFAPGELHLMFSGLKGPLEAGSTVTVRLVFERAGVVNAPFFVTNRVEEELARHGEHAGARHAH